MLTSFTIDDPIVDASDDYVEVTLTFADGQRRWCFFITPRYILKGLGAFHPTYKARTIRQLNLTSISTLGNRLTTREGLRFGMVCAPHMIIISEISEATIDETLRHLDEYVSLRRAPNRWKFKIHSPSKSLAWHVFR